MTFLTHTDQQRVMSGECSPEDIEAEHKKEIANETTEAMQEQKFKEWFEEIEDDLRENFIKESGEREDKFNAYCKECFRRETE